MGWFLFGLSGTDAAWSLAASAGVLVGIAAVLIWLGRRRARGGFQARLKGYKGKAVAMMDRLDALKARLKALPTEQGGFVEAMTGDTLALYEKTGRDLDALWDRWLDVMDVGDRAERKGEGGPGGVRRGDELVSDLKVFDEVEAGAVACSKAMDRLGSAHEDARAAAVAAEKAGAEATGRIEAVAAAGLPAEPYRPEADRIAAEVVKAAAVLAADPLGAKAALERAGSDAEALAGRAADALTRRDDAAKVREELTGLREAVAARRREGLRLDEEGGDPDGPAARVDQALADLQTALEAGDSVATARMLVTARAALGEAESILDAVVQARDAAATGLPEARRETRRLAEAVVQYEAFERELDREFAVESWRDVAGNLTQARTLLDSFDRKADEVGREADPQTQKHLLASRLLLRLNLEQRAVFQLMDAVGRRLSELKAAREQARRLGDELTAVDREIADFFRRHAGVVGGQARDALQRAVEASREAARLAAASPPDWPRALDAMRLASAGYRTARARAQSDLDVRRILSTEPGPRRTTIDARDFGAGDGPRRG